MKKTFGGGRLGSGKKMKFELQQFERSTHDLSSVLRTTISPGTLVPIQKLVGLPGDTFDMEFDVDIQTHPTIGPLFGSFKVQIDTFMIPMRLYNGLLHNNELDLGMNIEDVLFPMVELEGNEPVTGIPMDNQHTNPSSIFAYLGIRGIAGRSTPF